MAEERHKHALPNGYLFEGYRVEGILGAGSFGVTYKAREVAIDRLVAIKEYMPSGIATRDSHDSSVHPISNADAEEFEWGLDRFQKEAAVLVSFRHPNIVPVYRFFAANGTAYMVMEFQQGQSLSQLLISGRKLAEREIYDIVDPLLDGLERVHANGFLHRDIKPGNIYLRDDGSPVLIDFGAARQAMGERSRSLTRIFTPGYAPHEQYETNGNQGPWTDIYALGAVMYLMVSDQAPIDAPTRLSARARGNTDPLLPATSVARKGYSRQLLETIDRCLEVMEDDRPQSVAELRGHLLGRGGEEVASGRVAGTIMAGRAKSPRVGPTASVREPSLKEPARGGRSPLRLAAYAFAGVLLLSGAGVAGYVATDGFGAGDQGNQRRIAENEEARRKAAEEEAKRKAAEEEARRLAEAEEAKRVAAEEAAKRKAAEEEAKRQTETARRRAEEDARRKAEAEAAKRAAAEEAAKRAAAEEAAKRKAAEEEEIRRRVEAEIKRREDATRRAEEAKRVAAEEAAKRRAAAEEAAKRKAAEEEEIRKRVDAEVKRREAAARRAEEAKRQAETARARREAQEAARREAQEAARRKAAEEAARRRAGQGGGYGQGGGGGQGGGNPEEASAATATRMLALFNGRSVAFTRMQANWTNYVVFFQAGGVLTGNAFMRATGVMQDATQSRDSGRWFVRGDRLCMQWKEWDNGRTSCYQINGGGSSYSAAGGGLLAGSFQFR